MGTTSRDTRWGQVCVAIHTAMVAQLAAGGWSGDLACAIGPDEGAEHGAPPVIGFDHAGGESVNPALRGGSGAGARHPWDRAPTIGFEVWGRNPVESELLYEELLVAIDAVAHGRAGRPGNAKPELGSMTSGQLGTKYSGSFVVRVPIVRKLRQMVPAVQTVTAVAMSPAGVEVPAVETMVDEPDPESEDGP